MEVPDNDTLLKKFWYWGAVCESVMYATIVVDSFTEEMLEFRVNAYADVLNSSPTMSFKVLFVVLYFSPHKIVL
jgi:hypothetical protein